MSSNKLLQVAAIAVPLVLYIFTLCPGIPSGDSGMFIGTAALLGVAHPPGYPLYTMLSHLCTLLPFGPSVTWKVNLLSALFNSLTCLFLFLTLLRWTQNKATSLMAAILFACSPLIWKYSVIAEVFALNNFFTVLLLYVLTRLWFEQNIKWIYWGAAVIGLGLSNHHTFGLIAMPLAIFVIYRWQATVLNPKSLALVLCLFAVGLSPYLYIPWATLNQAAISWGNASTLDGFLWHFLRKDFGTFQLAGQKTESHFWLSNFFYLKRLFNETLLIGFPLALWGAYQWRKHVLLKTLTGVFVFYVIFFHALANIPFNHPISVEVHARFWQMSNVFVFLLLGLGASRLFEQKRLNPKHAWVIAIFACTLQVGINYKKSDQSWNTGFNDFGREVLQSLPEQALLISQGDVYLNMMRYLQEIDGVRKDVQVVDLEMAKMRWQKHRLMSLPEVLNAYAGRSAFTVSLPEPLLGSIRMIYDIIPHGHLYELRPKGQTSEFEIESYLQKQKQAFGKLPTQAILRAGQTDPSHWEYGLWSDYWDAWLRITAYLYQLQQTSSSLSFKKQALQSIEQILLMIQSQNSKAPDAVRNNLAIIQKELTKF